jgi:CRISPR-associated endoribonuclease Cas6
VYENGLGFFSHKGFGMLDVANSSTIRREENLEEAYA